MEKTLQSIQRKMMRTILGRGRKSTKTRDDDEDESESWVEWVRRVTHEAQDKMDLFAIPCWVEDVRRRKFRWAGHIVRRTDGRWTCGVLSWMPQGSRKRGRPHQRWTDSLCAFFKSLLGDTSHGNDMDEFCTRKRSLETSGIRLRRCTLEVIRCSHDCHCRARWACESARVWRASVLSFPIYIYTYIKNICEK